MSVVCQRCTNLFEPVGPCPRCGAAPPAVREVDSGTPVHGPRWQQSAWGRILIGLILAQGLFYGLRYLLTGILLATTGDQGDQVWDNLRLLLTLQAIQFVSVLLGGLLAGGGQGSGLALGAAVGAWNGVMAVLLRQNPDQAINLVGLYGFPLLHAAAGATGGLLGSLIWRPIPASGIPVQLAPVRTSPPPPRRTPLFAGPVAWFRVLAGAGFAVAGTLSATAVLEKVMEMSDGRLGTTSELQDQIITWELKALAVLLGGVLAGSTTSNGLKQGLVAAIAVSVILVGLQAPLARDWLSLAFFTVVSSFGLTMAGGWFGAQLFPPVLRRERWRPA